MKTGHSPHSLFFCLFVIAFAGCSAHSPFIAVNTTDVSRSGKSFPPHSERVFVTNQSLPQSVRYDIVGNIDVGSNWYGSNDKAHRMLADKARELGANAVIQVNVWRQPSGSSWAAPHARGTAVKILDPEKAKLDGLPGSWE